MSFAMTTDQIRQGTKTVTRRFGWWFLKPGDLVLPVEKARGVRKEDLKVIRGPLRVVSVRKEQLNAITADDCVREGYPESSPQDFVEMLCGHYGCEADKECNRIEFEYTDGEGTECPPVGM